MNYRKPIERTRTKEDAFGFAVDYGYITDTYYYYTCNEPCSLQKYSKNINGFCFCCYDCRKRFSVKTNTFLSEFKLIVPQFFICFITFLREVFVFLT